MGIIKMHDYVMCYIIVSQIGYVIPMLEESSETTSLYCLPYLLNDNPQEEYLSKIAKLFEPSVPWGYFTKVYKCSLRNKVFS